MRILVGTDHELRQIKKLLLRQQFLEVGSSGGESLVTPTTVGFLATAQSRPLASCGEASMRESAYVCPGDIEDCFEPPDLMEEAEERRVVTDPLYVN